MSAYAAVSLQSIWFIGASSINSAPDSNRAELTIIIHGKGGERNADKGSDKSSGN